MGQTIVNTRSLGLPDNLARKLGTDQIIIREVSEGLLLMPMTEHKENLRGLLKGKDFTTEKFFEQKRQDKELES